jgi:hypothetical protein
MDRGGGVMKLTHLLMTIPVVLGLNITPVLTEKAIAQVSCSVTGIQTGQLALRYSPNGRSRAGLDNGNIVTLLQQGSNPWVYVQVNYADSGVTGLKGWVNGNYLTCGGETNTPNPVNSCEVIGIQTGQLALRYSPNGRSRAGLNNGNVVRIIRYGNNPWIYVSVISANRGVRGLQGWVNGNYLTCSE